MITRIDHIGIAVQDLHEACKFFEDALAIHVDGVEVEEGERTQVAFFPVGQSEVELVHPLDAESGLSKFVAKRGEGVHHICFEVSDIDEAIERLKAHDVQLVEDSPRTNAQGQRYVFIHPKSAHGVLIELYQKGQVAARPPQLDLQSLRRLWDIETESARKGAQEFLRTLQHSGAHDGKHEQD